MSCSGRRQEQIGNRSGNIIRCTGMTTRYASANAEPSGGIPDRLLAVLLKSGCRRYCYLNPEGSQRLQAAAASLGEAPSFIDDTGGVHMIEMHAKLHCVQDGQPKADE